MAGDYKDIIHRDNTDHLSGRDAAPGSLSIAFGSGDSLTDSNGILSGDGNGTVDYSRGVARVRPSSAPAPVNNSYNIDFDQFNGSARQTASITPVQSSITHTLSGAPLKPGSVRISATMERFVEGYYHKAIMTTAGSGSSSGNLGSTNWEIKPFYTGTERAYYTRSAAAVDDGDGNLKRGNAIVGTVNYTTGEITFDLRDTYNVRVTDDGAIEDVLRPSSTGGAIGHHIYWEWDAPASQTEEYSSDTITVGYTLASDPVVSGSNAVDVDTLHIGLLKVGSLQIIPGSVMFEFAGKRYIDRDGSIVTDWNPATGAGVNVGSIDYGTATVTLNDWAPGADLTADIQLLSCLTWKGMRPTSATIFRTAGSPLRQGSLIINAVTTEHEEITAFADESGAITHEKIEFGYVDTETGTVWLEWAEPVFPDTVKYSAVAYKYLPLDSDLIGLDPTRLPSDGRVPVFLPGYVSVFSHTIETEVASPTAGATLSFTRDHQAEIWVKGANGETLDPAQYSLNRAAGELIWADPLTLETTAGDPVTTPLTVFDRVEDMVLLTDVQVSGQLGFNAPLSQTYPAGEAIVSSAVLHGDLRARVYNLFHQASWTGQWSDERIGDDTTAKFNNVAYPIEITNQGSIQERWHIRFTSSTGYQVVGETVGVVGTGSTSADTAIANPATGAPYFTIRANGWGSGWNAGNVVRFNTDGAQAPFWVARTILSGPATEENDSFSTQNRGDAD